MKRDGAIPNGLPRMGIGRYQGITDQQGKGEAAKSDGSTKGRL